MLPEALRRVVHLLARLPGVGEKSAQRYALYLCQDGRELPHDLAEALEEMSLQVGPCRRCGNIAEGAPDARLCTICADPRRDATVLCVVARVQDLLAVERSGAHRGRYFVLGKLLSPLDGVGPSELPLPALRSIVEADATEEIIVATPPSVDGEATALWLKQELESASLCVTRIASGVPHGGDLEFADQVTLQRSMAGRKNMASQKA